MVKIYWRVVEFVGYTFILHHSYNLETFELDKRWIYLGLYKYLGRYKNHGSLKLIRIWGIKIR